MSKIEDFQKARSNYKRIHDDVQKALGRDRTDNDKHRVIVRFTGLQDGDWAEMGFSVHLSHGYYGSSSGASDTSVELGGFLAKAIENNMAMLLDKSVALAESNMVDQKSKAADEARDVLTEIEDSKAI